MNEGFKRKFQGLWIPVEILRNSKLSGYERFLLAEIDSLDCEIGCYATNEHFMAICGCSESTISRAIAKLEKLGLIYYDEKSTINNRILHSCLNGNAPKTSVPDEVKETKNKRFVKPTVEEIQEYCDERKNNVDAEAFYDFYESKGWVVGKTPMKDWKSSVRTWERNNYGCNRPTQKAQATDKKPRDLIVDEVQDTTPEVLDFLDLWEKALGMRPRETNENIAATKSLLNELGYEKAKALIYALSRRAGEKYLISEVRKVSDPATLYENRQYVWDYFLHNAKKWKEWEDKARQGKKPWEL